jgi:hypothetical protein
MSTGGEQWEEDEGRSSDRPAPGRRSGAVTAVAIVNFVLGGLGILVSIICMVAAPTIMALVLGAAQEQAKQQGMQGVDLKDAKGLAGFLAGLGIFLGACGVILATLPIIAGLGVHKRRQWGRIMTLVLGALAGIAGVIGLLSLNPAALVDLGYCILVYVVLLQGKYAAEFR